MKKGNIRPTLNLDDESRLYVSGSAKDFASAMSHLELDSKEPDYDDEIYPRDEACYAGPAKIKAIGEAKHLFSKANALIQKNQHMDAITLYDKILVHYPHHRGAAIRGKIKALDKRADFLISKKKYGQAEKYLHIAMKLDPYSPFTNLNLGNLWQYRDSPDFEKATRYYNIARKFATGKSKFILEVIDRQIELLPRHAIKFYMKNFKYDEAFKYKQQIEEIAGSDEVSWNRLARLYFQLDDFESVHRSYDRAMEITTKKHEGGKYNDVEYNNRLLQYFHNKSFIYNVDRDSESALCFINAAIEQKNSDPMGWKHLAIAFGNMGIKKYALKSIEVAIKLDPLYVEGLYHKAVILKSMNQIFPAIGACEKALNLSDESEKGHYKIQSFLAELTTLYNGEFCTLHNSAVRSAVKKDGALAKKAASFRAMGAYDLAIEYYSRSLDVLTRESRKPLLLNDIAVCHILKHEHKQAQAILSDAAQMESYNMAGILCNMGISLMMQGSYKEAKESLSQAVAISHDRGYYYFNKSISEFLAGEYDNWSNSIKQAICLADDEELHLGGKLERQTMDHLALANKMLNISYDNVTDSFIESHKALYETLLAIDAVLCLDKDGLVELLLPLPERICLLRCNFDENVVYDMVNELDSYKQAIIAEQQLSGCSQELG